MDEDIGEICAEGFSFFGSTNRLISHELKNILAIINETWGYIGELLELSETGMELKPGELQSLGKSMTEEIERANSIIRNMNTLAHSVDEFITETEITQDVSLMVELSQLDSAMRKTRVRLVESEACVIYTSPFFLKNLIYHVISFSLRSAGPEKEVQISFDFHNSGAKIIFSGLDSTILREFPTRNAEILAKAISAEISVEAPAGELHVVLPKKLNSSPIRNLLAGD